MWFVGMPLYELQLDPRRIPKDRKRTQTVIVCMDSIRRTADRSDKGLRSQGRTFVARGATLVRYLAARSRKS
jgi:hypothetical protein